MDNIVELIGCYGGDKLHAASAWTSTNRDITPEKEKRIPELLKMLAENGHHTPFEKSMLHFLLTVDTATHIQLLKHRIGVSVNAESARYKELKADKFYVPTDWTDEQLIKDYMAHMENAYDLYHRFTAYVTASHSRKRAKESARFVLPYANQLVLDVSFNFRSFMHFLQLRKSDDAQKEIHDIADKMLDLVKATDAFPHSLIAFGY